MISAARTPSADPWGRSHISTHQPPSNQICAPVPSWTSHIFPGGYPSSCIVRLACATTEWREQATALGLSPFYRGRARCWARISCCQCPRATTTIKRESEAKQSRTCTQFYHFAKDPSILSTRHANPCPRPPRVSLISKRCLVVRVPKAALRGIDVVTKLRASAEGARRKEENNKKEMNSVLLSRRWSVEYQSLKAVRGGRGKWVEGVKTK